MFQYKKVCFPIFLFVLPIFLLIVTHSLAGPFGFLNKPEARCSTGVVLGGYCWHADLSTGSDSCGTVCSSYGGEVPQGSSFWAGTQGSLANCILVANSFPNPPGASEQNSNDADAWDSCTGDWDCFYGNKHGRRYCRTQTSTSPQIGVYKYCACRY